MTSKLTREQVIALITEHSYDSALVDALEYLLAAMDSEPVAEVCEDYAIRYISSGPAPKEGLHPGDKLYRHAQQPVVPDAYVRDELGRMMLNGICEPKIGFGAGWNACRAAMLQAGNSPVIPGWIPVSERMPESNGVYFGWDGKRVLEVNCFFGGFSANQFIHGEITHWMPLPAAPQEVK